MEHSEPAISRSVAVHYRVVPNGFEDGVLVLLSDHAIHEDTVQELKRLSDSPITIRRVDRRFFSERMNLLYGVGASALSPSPDTSESSDDFSHGSVIRFVSQILNEAADRNASDIHMEPGPSNLRIRLRIDGLMQTVPVPEDVTRMRANIAARIKVLAGLDPTPSREPKDGRMKHDRRDLRVSILPTLHGESVHLRFLTPPDELPDLCHLGLSNTERSVLLEAMSQKGGLVVACGPTGSGKSTTLHALLKEGAPRTVKVITVEDPVEYEIDYATQIEVTRSLPFSRSLRSVLRHDPDVLLIGEIRDRESAVIALEAALTGHLVLTSIHTETELQAINRFMQFGVSSGLIASALHVMVSQRLIRKICPSCNGTGTVESNQPCDRCMGSGYHGRTGIFRILPVSESLRDALQREEYVDVGKIMDAAAPSFESTGRRLVDAGQTTHEELFRVLGREDVIHAS